MRPIVLGDHHHPGRPAVEAMHDAGPQLAADAAQVLDVVQERVDEGAVGVARGGMDDHAGGLVDDHEVRVVVEDFEWQRLGPRHRRGGRGDHDAYDIAVADGRARARCGPVEYDPPRPDQPLDL